MNKFLYLIIVICFLDLFVQLPIITPFALSLGADEYTAGIIVAIYSLFNMVGNVFGGFLSDKFGRRNMLLFGMGLQIIILLTYTVVPSVGLLILIRIVHGFSSGLLTPAAFSLVADISKKSAIGRSMALTGVSIGVAAVLGPALGGIISSQASYQTVYFIMAVIFVFGTTLILAAVKESTTEHSREIHYRTNFGQIITRPSLIVAYISAFTLMVSNGSLAFGLPLKVSGIGLSEQSTGAMLSVFGIVAILIFATPINRIYSKYSPVALVSSGIFIVGLAMVLLHVVPTVGLIYTVMVIYGVGFSFIFPSMNKIIGQNTEMHERGKANGVFYSFFSLGSVAGSYLSGIFATYFETPFLFIGLILIILLAAVQIAHKKSGFTHSL
ncbi:MFS transporter [Salinicoccus sp. ID82-1]|uniref:MFS transporter n=1 Tax=Salinicoccus cyprini TaxID=2493691 RepID=A0A558AR18_9STAP|nr:MULTISPECIES: MFS transporter [Salinicoccus]MCG1010258.1 MFS transporter [Salinicoccus sp. ID82-1]TVT26688.1 MFS transporter [Salinicoccus cyprini]